MRRGGVRSHKANKRRCRWNLWSTTCTLQLGLPRRHTHKVNTMGLQPSLFPKNNVPLLPPFPGQTRISPPPPPPRNVPNNRRRIVF